MKIFFPILSSLLISLTNLDEPNDKLSLSPYTENSITGTWIMCKIVSEEMETLFNVCPTFTFALGGKGTIASSRKTICDFLYEVKGTSIEFSFKSLQDKKDFITGETTFVLEFYDNGKRMDIISSKKDYKLLMSKGL